jgi:hypothetical protein
MQPGVVDAVDGRAAACRPQGADLGRVRHSKEQ